MKATTFKIPGISLVLIVVAMFLFSLATANATGRVLDDISLSCIPSYGQIQYNNLLTNVVVDSYSHALERHPEALMVRECFDKNGPYMQFLVDKSAKRILQVCVIEPGKIGFRVVDKVGKVWKERTAYIHEKMSCIKDVIKYAEDMGFCKNCWLIK